jgi:adenylate kinase
MMNRRQLFLWMAGVSGLKGQGPGHGLVIVLVGPPGSGRSTQAGYLRKRYRVPVVDIDRLKVRAGESVDDAVDRRLRELDAAKGFVLDGYPRTRAQAEHLNRVVGELKLAAPIIVQLDVPDEVARERVRKQTRGRMGAFEEQLTAYKAELALMREVYPEADIWTVNGTRAPEQVAETIEMLVRERR